MGYNRRSSIGTCAAAPTSPHPPPGFNHPRQQRQPQPQQYRAPLRRLSQHGSSTSTYTPGPEQRRASIGTCAAAPAPTSPPPPPGFDDSSLLSAAAPTSSPPGFNVSSSSLMSAYDLLDIDMLKEIDPDSVVEVQLPGKRGSVTRRRSITFHEDIDSPASFDDDKEITTNDDNATTATTAKRTATTANNDSFNESFVLSWDMSPSKLHDATKISKIDSELLEQSMQNFLLGEVTAAKTSNSSSSSALTSKECRRASIA